MSLSVAGAAPASFRGFPSATAPTRLSGSMPGPSSPCMPSCFPDCPPAPSAPHAAEQLCVQVFLVATPVGREDDVCRRTLPVVGQIEEVAVVVEEPLLALLHGQV